MKLVVETAVIFFGTMLAAALVALGEPAHAEVELARSVPAVLATAGK